MPRDIVVGIVGDASKLNKATTDAVGHAESTFSKLRSSVAKGFGLGAGISGFSLLTDAIRTGVDQLGEARQAYLDDKASQDLLAQSLKNNVANWDGNTAGVERYASAQARLGFTDDEVRDSIGQLVGVTHDLEEAQKLNTLAQDLARAKGIDLATASDIVTKAYQGNGKALKALGIDTAGATDAAGLLAAIQQNATGAAEVWAAGQGKAEVANIKVGEAMEKVGGIVDKVAQVAIPILADALSFVVDSLSAVWEAIQPVVSALADVLGPAMEALAPIAKTVFGIIIDAVRLASGVIGGVISGIRGLINTVIGGVNSVIRGINNISIPSIDVGPVHFEGWSGVNLPYIPRFHTGGIVPGSPGSDQLAILQAGERVIPKGGGNTIVINIESFIGSDRDIDRFADRIAYRLSLTR